MPGALPRGQVVVGYQRWAWGRGEGLGPGLETIGTCGPLDLNLRCTKTPQVELASVMLK